MSAVIFAQFGNQYDLNIRGRMVGDNNSDASFYTAGISKNIFKFPLKKGKKGVISIGIDYDYAHVNFKADNEVLEKIENLHNIGLNINYFRKLSAKWSLIGRLNPQLNSNFTDGIKGDDFYLNAFGILNYTRSKDSRLSFGLAYSNTLGYPAPIPVVSYWKRFNEKWEMGLGFPRTSVTRTLSLKSKLVGYAELQGYNGNISENIPNPNSQSNIEAERVSYRDIITGIEYRYQIKKFELRVNGGYTVNRNFELQDSNNETAYEFNMENNLNFGVGLGFNF
ncbi:hypothetical protein UJ101_00906 [Flavobacteriaceae bacterium UJ101]|nr:hypothetical protein UJ101_00906 [Flavobacteriaceae bacterium UJ101]